jgi:modulator of FtsH protease
MTALIFVVPAIAAPVPSMVIMFGSYAIAHFVAPKMVFGEQKVAGFIVGSVFQGIAMGYLLLAAILVGQVVNGNPFGLILTALGLTGLTSAGMVAYVWANPKEFKMLGAFLSAMFIPMMILMVLSFVFPIGGTMGLLLTGVFVVISAAGLLYQVNVVMHKLNTDQHVEGSYLITMGVLILFWNLLSLLIQLTNND